MTHLAWIRRTEPARTECALAKGVRAARRDPRDRARAAWHARCGTAGGAIGAFVAKIGDEESERVSLHDGELDAAIGVNGGDLGAPNLEHPPATRGTYSAAAAGGSSSAGATAAGPMQTPED